MKASLASPSVLCKTDGGLWQRREADQVMDDLSALTRSVSLKQLAMRGFLTTIALPRQSTAQRCHRGPWSLAYIIPVLCG